MKYGPLGRSGLIVSRICLGGNSWGAKGRRGWGKFDEAEAPAYFKRALDVGITFFDTADNYNAGRSEEIMGATLMKMVKREEIVLSTKVGIRQSPAPNDVGTGRKHLMASIDAAAQAPADRLHRRLPGPPARSAHADGRDHVLARPARALGQGALHRRLDHAGLQVRPDGDDRRLEGLCPADRHAEPLQHDPARGRARDEPAVPRAGRRAHSLFAAGARLPGRQPQQGRRRRHRALEERRAGPGRHLSRLRLGDRRAAEEGRGRARMRRRRRPRSPGCSASPTWARPSSAPPTSTS